MRRSNGFSLVELLTVMTILVAVLSFIVVSGTEARRRARRSQARSEIAALETALQAYRTDLGVFPKDGAGATVNADVVRQLSGLDASGNTLSSLPADWHGPYMEFDRARLSSGAGEFLDPWGRPYVVLGLGDDAGTTAANLKNKYTFDILSTGPDGVNQSGASGSDDVTNF